MEIGSQIRASGQASVSGTENGTGVATPRSALKWGLLALAIGYFWFRLINNLRLEWSTNPQYSYGWVVPLLCVGLLMRRWQGAKDSGQKRRRESGEEKAQSGGPWSVVIAFAVLAFLYLPTRLVEAATPEWRPIQWALAFEAAGLTLGTVYLGGGRGWLRRAAFPVCFFLIAVPWPTLIETPVIQGLSRFNASMVVEVLGVFGVPAIQHGNALEVSAGAVGIDDACSGIRSLQSSLMVSLFLGEFYWLSKPRRILLVLGGFLLAIAFNVCRTSFLTFMAAKTGLAAINQYHDEAGISILLACTAVMWGVAVMLKQSGELITESGGRRSEVGTPESAVGGPLRALGVGLIVWLVVVESGVQLWYRVRESRILPGVEWSVALPEANPTFKILPLAEKARKLLRFDEGKEGQWREEDGTVWQAFYFSWAPGRVAGYLAKRHTPDICMPAAGRTLRSGPELTILKVNDVELPMRGYVFESAGSPLYVYQCRWEAGEGRETYVAQESARYNLVRGIWAGRGIHGQKVLELMVSGYQDSELAKQALLRQLEKLIKVEAPGKEIRDANLE